MAGHFQARRHSVWIAYGLVVCTGERSATDFISHPVSPCGRPVELYALGAGLRNPVIAETVRGFLRVKVWTLGFAELLVNVRRIPVSRQAGTALLFFLPRWFLAYAKFSLLLMVTDGY